MHTEIKSIWLRYWKYYGGIAAIVKSPYFWCAFILTFLCLPIAFPCLIPKISSCIFKRTDIIFDINTFDRWYDVVLSVTPSILGFTLGGYAILLAFGDKKFFRLFVGPYRNHPTIDTVSPYQEMNASFVHFILMQFLATSLGVIGKIFNFTQGFFVIFALLAFFYSLATGVAATMGVFRISLFLEPYIQHTMAEDDQNNT